MSKGWDSTALKKLKALTGKGLSTAEIGKRLGISKNAVVGKLNRLGWNSKAGGAPADAADAKKVAKKSATVTKTAAKKAVKSTAQKKTTAKAAPVAAKKAASKKATVSAKKSVAAPKKAVGSVKAAPVAANKSAKDSKKNLAMHQRIIQHSLEMANLKPNQCRWPIGDPDSENFHFCGETVFVGKPYCYEHCRQAYQFTPPKKKQ